MFFAALSGAGATPATSQEVDLVQAVDSALVHHPTLAAARATLRGVEAEARAARAGFLPSMAATSRLTRFQEPMVVAPLHGFDPSRPPDFDRTVVQSRLGVEYTVFDGGQRSATARAARERAEAAGARLDGTRAQLLEATAAAYLAVSSARGVTDAARLRQEALAAELARARLSHEQGTAAYVEVARAQATVTNARDAVNQAASSVLLAEGRLARLTGAPRNAVEAWTLRTPTTGLDPVSAGLDSLLHPETAEVETAEVETPRIRAAERAVAAARAGVSRARAARLPSLSGTAGLVNYAGGAGDVTTEWQAGLSLSWPVFTGGARGARIAAAEAELVRTEEALRLLRLDASESAESAGVELARARTRLAAVQDARTEWEEVARIEILRMENGVGVQSDLLLAQARLFQARADLARTQNDIVLAHVRIARAHGTLTRDWLQAALEAQP